MIASKRQYELFETKWLMRRQNPGAESPYLQGYLLGFNGLVNITDAVNPVTKKGVVKIKIGNGEVQTKEVDFTGMPINALTADLAVDAFTDAGFDLCTFSVDAETGRFMLSPDDSAIKWVQIYGDLAAALHFGDCRLNEGKGCYIYPSFDGDLKSVNETEQWSDVKTIENDSPKGKPVKLTTPGKRTGTQIVITDRLSSRAAKQMINGGRWIKGAADIPDIYEPPTGTGGEPARVDVFSYSEVYDKNTNVEGDEAYIRERMYIGCVGKHIRSGGSGSWSDSEYTLTAADYADKNGVDHASPRESDYTRAQWDSMQMSGVIVTDWENA